MRSKPAHFSMFDVQLLEQRLLLSGSVVRLDAEAQIADFTEGALGTVEVAAFTASSNTERAADFSATINWGDRTSSIGSIAQSGNSFVVTGQTNGRRVEHLELEPDMEQAKPRTVDAEWKRWIAENVLLNKEESSIIAAMVREGFEAALAAAEVRAAMAHPYITAARQLALKGTSQTDSRDLEWQLKKRDWVLECLRRSAKLDPATRTVPRVRPPSSDQFLHEYYAANRPVVIEGAMDDWDALEKWTGPNLKQRFGDRLVEVQANRSSDQNYERNSTRLRKVVSFGEFVDIAESPAATNDWYMTAQNSGKNSDALRELWNDIIPFPHYLSSTPGKTSGFFWYGPSGTLTPLHHDLTNNFMAQVRGSKRVKLIAPAELPRLYNDRHCFSQVDPAKPDLDRHPQFADVCVIDVLIGPGDLLFLPVGWWHHVQAVGTSITMTFTNFIYENDFSSFYPQGG